MAYLERFARKRRNRTETLTARVDPDTYQRFQEHCNGLGLTVSEAVALLIEREIGDTTRTKISKDIPSDDGEKQMYTSSPQPPQYQPRQQQPRRSGGRFTTKPFVIGGRLPCPICGTWPERQANISRHMREIHDSTTEEIYKAHMETVEKMVQEEKARLGGP